MKKLLLITALLTGVVLNFSYARNASVLVCENDYGEVVEFLYNFSGKNPGNHFGQEGYFSQDIYDVCVYEERLLKAPHSNMDKFVTNLKSAVTDDSKFMLFCASLGEWGGTFIYAYEDEGGGIQSKKGFYLENDYSVEITGSPNCYDDY